MVHTYPYYCCTFPNDKILAEKYFAKKIIDWVKMLGKNVKMGINGA